MTECAYLFHRRLQVLDHEWRRRLRPSIALSIALHLLLAVLLRNVQVWPAPREPVQGIGYPGPTHLINLVPIDDILAEQERLARERLLAGALLSQSLALEDLPEDRARAVPGPLPNPGPVVRLQLVRPEAVPVFELGEDWSRPTRTSEGALSQDFQTLRIVRPEYPRRAIRDGIDGLVELEVRVDAEGKVVEVRVRRSPPSGSILAQAAVEAMRQWEFRPLRRERRSVPFTVIVPFRFRLEG